jgi:hypothetical protein
MAQRRKKAESARRKGRRWMMIAYFAFVVVIVVVCTVEVSLQAFARPHGNVDDSVKCAEGIASLARAVDRGLVAVNDDTLTEFEAVDKYRNALEPEWSMRGSVRAACEGDEGKLEALDAVVHMGFAEEHTVRHNAFEIAPFRRRARELLMRELPGLTLPSRPVGSAR